MSKPKDVLTTGEVARICNVAPRTVSKWFDTGQLRGYRIPGSRDRRIPLSQLVRFMKAHGIPLNGLETGQMRLLVIDEEPELALLLQRTLSDTGQYEVRVADSAIEAGLLLEQFRPNVILVDVDVAGIDTRGLVRLLSSHGELQGIHLIATSASLTDADCHRLTQQGFAATLRKPFSIHQLADLIDETTSVLT
jgi:excisionase family DNA binding protein